MAPFEAAYAVLRGCPTHAKQLATLRICPSHEWLPRFPTFSPKSLVGVSLLYPGPLRTSLIRSGFCDSEQSREREENFLSACGLPLQRVAHLALDRLLYNPSRIVIGLDY